MRERQKGGNDGREGTTEGRERLSGGSNGGCVCVCVCVDYWRSAREEQGGREGRESSMARKQHGSPLCCAALRAEAIPGDIHGLALPRSPRARATAAHVLLQHLPQRALHRRALGLRPRRVGGAGLAAVEPHQRQAAPELRARGVSNGLDSAGRGSEGLGHPRRDLALRQGVVVGLGEVGGARAWAAGSSPVR